MIVVHLLDRQRSMRIDGRWFRRLARLALRAESVQAATLGVVFVENSAMVQLHQRYFGRKDPTDVITFPLSEPGARLAGEIVISTQVARARAAEFSWPGHVEAGLYLVHGILHLCGYDDRTPAPARRMQVRQEHLLERHLASPAGKHYASSRRRGLVSMD
jgi:probable rRNA maturation factor